MTHYVILTAEQVSDIDLALNYFASAEKAVGNTARGEHLCGLADVVRSASPIEDEDFGYEDTADDFYYEDAEDEGDIYGGEYEYVHAQYDD